MTLPPFTADELAQAIVRQIEASRPPDLLIPTIIGGVCWLVIAVEVLYVSRKLNGAGEPIRVWHRVYSAAFAITGVSSIVAALPVLAAHYREWAAWMGVIALIVLAVVYLIGQVKTTKMHNERNKAYHAQQEENRQLRGQANGLVRRVKELSGATP